MSLAPNNEQDGTESYVNIRLRFEADITAAVGRTDSWPGAVAAAIRAALVAATDDQPAARRLVMPATGRRTDDLAAFDEMVADLAARLRRGAPAGLGSERAARNVVLRIARQVCLRLETRSDEPPTALAPDLIVFVLTPYIGMSVARRLADQPIEIS